MNDQIAALEEQIEYLIGRVDQLDREVTELADLTKAARTRPTKVSLANICALDADRPSEVCADANVYRYQQGCRGVACVREYRDYYSKYRKRRAEIEDAQPDTVE